MSTIVFTAAQISQWFVERIASALSVPPAEIDTAAPFTDHGLDSVGALQITAELEAMLNRPVSATLLWEYPTISSLSEYLATT